MIKITIGAIYELDGDHCYNIVTNGVTKIKVFKDPGIANYDHGLTTLLVELKIIPDESQRQYDNNDIHRMAASHEARSIHDKG